MGSSVPFLVYSWVLLPLLAAGKASVIFPVSFSEPPPCVFPFVFGGRSFSSCTSDGAGDGQLWCATTPNYDTDRQWKQCALQEHGGNSEGRPCVFPFTYWGDTYYTCTSKNSRKGRFWCATTGSYDKDRKWSYCADTRLNENPTGPCVFPFTYNGKSQSTCIADGMTSGKLWCSLSSNYDMNSKWTYCEPSEPRPCQFPFIYRNRSYSSCITKGTSDGHLWCATTSDYDKDSKWKMCVPHEYGGNSEGKECHFPFTYKKQTFFDCTDQDEPSGRFWCATTKDYDEDKRWSFCADINRNPGTAEQGNNTASQELCSFPFTYKGKTYSSCTTEGEFSGKLWCSLTSNYIGRWKYCQPSDLPGQNSYKS
ncbi:epididymal sperm-binding protein 1-like [Tiliqua scincoides]|uniref:epididymal sperm-binding protein 1-like n=1 Tax=Tiliqua scincoides TaxID=71010 RepID=UPI00346356D0